MVSMFSGAQRLSGVGVWVWALAVHAASPGLSGLFRASELGIVEFTAGSNGQLVGRARAGGACGFTIDTEVISGSFEGDTFAGTVTVCQQGPSCSEKQKRYPFLGVWNADGVVGMVKLDPGCASDALTDRRLVVRPATAEDKARVAPKPVAKPGEIEALYEEGDSKLAVGEFVAAKELFLKVIAFEDPVFTLAARIGLGVAQIGLKEYPAAIENLEKATALGVRLKDFHKASQAAYNLACAQAKLGHTKEAIDAVRQAVQFGKPGQYVADLERDADLVSIRSDPDFRKVVAEARLQREPRKRGK